MRFYPRAFRELHGVELTQSLRDAVKDARARGRSGTMTLLWLVADTVVTAARAHGTRWRSPNRAGLDRRDEKGDGMVQGVIRDLRYAVRSLRRSPGFTATAVLTLGLGVGANTAVFSLVHAVLLKPLPYQEASSLVHIQNRYLPGGSTGWVSVPEFWEYRTTAVNEGFVAFAGLSPDAANLTGLERPLRVQGMRVTPEFFDVVGARAGLGRTFSAEDSRPGAAVVVIGHGLWSDAFGSDPDVLGKTLELDGVSRTVVGVMSGDYEPLSGYVFPGRAEDYWLPVVLDPTTFDGELVERHSLFVLGQLTPRNDPASAEQVLEDAVRRLERTYPDISNAGSRDVAVTPLRDMVAGPVRETLMLLTVAVTLLLLVAAVNVANLALARGDTRAGEVAVRAALGAGRSRLLSAALAESLVLGLAAGALGAILVIATDGLLSRMVPAGIPLPGGASVGLPVLGFTFAAALTAGAVAGMGPAWRLARGDVFATTKVGGATAPTSRGLTRQGLVVAQVATAVVLVASSALLVRSLRELRSVETGFDPTDLHIASVSAARAEYNDGPAVRDLYRRIVAEVESVPGVMAVAASWQTPLQTGMSDWPVMPERGGDTEWYSADPNLVTPEYFQTMGIELVEGRLFDASDQERPVGAVILNREGARRLWGGAPAVGRRVNLDFGEPVWREVIGVVEDVRGRGLAQDPTVQTYMTMGDGPFARVSSLTLSVQARGGGDGLLQEVRRAVARVDPEIPVGEMEPFESQIARSLERERLLSLLITVFATLALALGAIGVYGLVSYSVSRRTREIGVRIALGAGSRGVLHLVLRRAAALAGVGVLVGLGMALLTGRLLEGFLFGVSRGDPATLALVSAGVFGVATLASLVPALRASKVPPTVALREE